jgi:1,4-alpha-glucan branching enzyme
MTIKKTYFKTKKTCKVNFRLPKDVVNEADSVNLVGEFNQWNTKATPLKKLKNGTFTTDLELEKGRSYQFRYLIDEQRWENDGQADGYVTTPFGDSENSIISV